MATFISGNTCFNAWANVSNHLIRHPQREETNIIIEISNPCDFTDIKAWMRNYNPEDFDKDGDKIRHVINTIFPHTFRAYFQNRQDFYDRYCRIFTDSHYKKWGTYFQRLISFGKGFNGTYPNQLENAISALKGESPQKYFITFHLTASNIESNVRPLGGPCWQYGELIINSNGGIDLIAVYRNHDYFNKALGNFIGLAKLLEFICIESQQTPGNLIVHSIHAYSSKPISKLSQLLNN